MKRRPACAAAYYAATFSLGTSWAVSHLSFHVVQHNIAITDGSAPFRSKALMHAEWHFIFEFCKLAITQTATRNHIRGGHIVKNVGGSAIAGRKSRFSPFDADSESDDDYPDNSEKSLDNELKEESAGKKGAAKELRSPGAGVLKEFNQKVLVRRTQNADLEDEVANEFEHSPVVYRYFGRSRIRTHRSDSLPFILLGPSVDHWKAVGNILSSRGFDVIACEIERGAISDGRESIWVEGEGSNLVLSVLEALRWKNAILVACEGEACLAIEAALGLSPDKVVGLVLCGDLTSPSDFAAALATSETGHADEMKSPFFLDSYLIEYLRCPFAVLWDGRIKSEKKATREQRPIERSRYLILGGGSSPHRRLPEQFSWILTRFVEEKVTQSVDNALDYDLTPPKRSLSKQWGCISLPRFFDDSSAVTVFGRIVATAIFYATSLKIVVYQYQNVRSGVLGLHSGFKTLSSVQRRLLQMIVNVLGSLRLFPIGFGHTREKAEATVEERTTGLNSSETIEDNDDKEEEKEPEEYQKQRQIEYLDRVVV